MTSHDAHHNATSPHLDATTTEHLETLPTIKEDPSSTLPNGKPTTAGSLRPRSSTATSSRIYGVRTALGLHGMAPIDEEHDTQIDPELVWPRIRLALREPFLEFWGVFILIMFGNGSVAQVLLSGKPEFASGAPGRSGFGEYQSINWAWGLGVMLGIYVAGDSGAYLNPAVTLAFCLYRKLPWRRFPMFMLAQLLGGFVASGVVYANYINAIDAYAGVGVRTVPPASTATGQIFCTYPQPFLTKASQFFSEFIATTLLVFLIFALKDGSNTGGIRGDGNWFPLGLFFIIFGIGACFGYDTGYAINIARDFGPRLMSYILGYSGVWAAGDYYFWIPMVAPFCGAVFGGFLYDVFIYTGPESPINSPYMGFGYLLRPDKALKARWRERENEVPGGAGAGYIDPTEQNRQFAPGV